MGVQLPGASASMQELQGWDVSSRPTWQRQCRLDSVGLLRERFHTVETGGKRYKLSGRLQPGSLE